MLARRAVDYCFMIIDCSHGALQVADFGLARHAAQSRIDTDSFGTITHTPPELLREGCVLNN